MIRKILILPAIISIVAIFSNFAQKPANSGLQTGTNIGNIAPELNFPGPDGKLIALSSLRGKLVLIDFWASWCPPCRAENPNVVNAYRTYKDKQFTGGKGFTLYSVSLDKTKANWISAIKADNLEWPSHVSDLKWWNSEGAALYKVTEIPSNFLIDGTGKIIAKNLRGAALSEKLAQLQKK